MLVTMQNKLKYVGKLIGGSDRLDQRFSTFSGSRSVLSQFADHQGRREPRRAPGQKKLSIYSAKFQNDLF